MGVGAGRGRGRQIRPCCLKKERKDGRLCTQALYIPIYFDSSILPSPTLLSTLFARSAVISAPQWGGVENHNQHKWGNIHAGIHAGERRLRTVSPQAHSPRTLHVGVAKAQV
jgi:hypothetical protein